MTLMSFGRAVPIQMDMLNLVGYEFAARDMQPAVGLNARKRAMREGRHALKQATGVDFGYDAVAWRELLISHGDEFGYTHPYAFQTVDRAVQAALADPEVLATLATLAESG